MKGLARCKRRIFVAGETKQRNSNALKDYSWAQGAHDLNCLVCGVVDLAVFRDKKRNRILHQVGDEYASDYARRLKEVTITVVLHAW